MSVCLCVCVCTHLCVCVALHGLSSWAWVGISSTHSAGNQPTFPLALPSQKHPSPIDKTGGREIGRGEDVREDRVKDRE